MLNTRTLRDRSSSRDPESRRQTPMKQPIKDEMKQESTVNEWVEPPLIQKSSYKETTGGSTYGAAEYMQALGEAPNMKVKARVKADGARKSVIGKVAGASGVDAQETPESTPAPQGVVDTEANMPSQTALVVDDERDTDYAPAAKKKERVTKTRAAKRLSEGPAKAAAKAKHKMADSDNTKVKPIVNQNKKYDAIKLKSVVESAKARAEAAGKPRLAAAVEELYRRSLTSARLTILIENILTQTATKQDTEEFNEFVKAAKRKVKDTGVRQSPERTNNAQTLPHRSPSKPTSTEKEASVIPSTEQSDPPKVHVSEMPKSAPKERGRDRVSSRVTKSKSPTKKSSTRSPVKKAASGSPSKKRSNSVGSDSSLTSLTSNQDEDEDMDVDEPEELTNGPTSARAGVNGINGKDHAAERGSLAPPSRATKRSSADADLLEEERDRAFAAKKAKLMEGVRRNYDVQESNLRTQAASKLRSLRGNTGTLAPPTLSTAAATRGATTRGSRAPSPDVDSPLSDLSPLSSRQSTPQVNKAPAKPAGKRAKTKQSPEKKHQQPFSGMAGAGGAGRESPIGDDDSDEVSENNDFCSACGGSGFLLCCDGCDRSFHFACLDPPLNEDASELNEPWFCYICVAKRPFATESPEKLRGLFAPLFGSLKKRNPSNFALPEDIRNYYEGVATDKNGAFMDAVHPKTKNRSGYDEVPDYTKIKDSKGNTILCYSCGKSSEGTRQIITCDVCSEAWHLDCLDPPLANPPARNLEGKKVHGWTCPLHIDHELRKINVSMLNPPRIGRTIHLRKPRNAKVMPASQGRGYRNNGIIEVSDDDSDSHSEFEDDEDEGGVIHRLPASGIKLDFIDKVKSTRIQNMRDHHAYRRARIAAKAVPHPLLQANFARRSIREQQVALNLAQFASTNQDLNLGNDQVENLVGALIAEATPDVVNEIEAAEAKERAKSVSSAIPPSPPASEQTDQLGPEQRRELKLLQELIRRKLENSKP